MINLTLTSFQLPAALKFLSRYPVHPKALQSPQVPGSVLSTRSSLLLLTRLEELPSLPTSTCPRLLPGSLILGPVRCSPSSWSSRRRPCLLLRLRSLCLLRSLSLFSCCLKDDYTFYLPPWEEACPHASASS